MARAQLISLLILLVLVFGLVLAGTVAFSEGRGDGQDLATPPDTEQESVPPRPSNWDPAWRYERRFA